MGSEIEERFWGSGRVIIGRRVVVAVATAAMISECDGFALEIKKRREREVTVNQEADEFREQCTKM
jgi:hypothetical protein